MGSDSPKPLQDTTGLAAYDRQGVERFFLEAHEERVRLLGETAAVRRRIAAAEATLAGASDEEFQSVRAVLEGQRLLREEVRANERAIVAVAESAEAEAARILASARARAATELTSNRVERREPGDQARFGFNGRGPDGHSYLRSTGRF